MRIPSRRIYRAFPEFDQYDDATCERYMLRIRAQGLPIRAYAGVVAAVILGAMSYAASTTPILDVLQDSAQPLHIYWFTDYVTLGDLAIADGVVSFVAVPMIVGVLTRDLLLYRAVRRIVVLARCNKCRQSLIGLPIQDLSSRPWVRCPECGKDLELVKLGLNPADLDPAAASADPPAEARPATP